MVRAWAAVRITRPRMQTFYLRFSEPRGNPEIKRILVRPATTTAMRFYEIIIALAAISARPTNPCTDSVNYQTRLEGGDLGRVLQLFYFLRYRLLLLPCKYFPLRVQCQMQMRYSRKWFRSNLTQLTKSNV